MSKLPPDLVLARPAAGATRVPSLWQTVSVNPTSIGMDSCGLVSDCDSTQAVFDKVWHCQSQLLSHSLMNQSVSWLYQVAWSNSDKNKQALVDLWGYS